MGLIIQLLVSSLVMLLLSKTLPGFEIKNFKTAVIVALLYGVLMLFSSCLAVPLAALWNGLDWLVSWIPIIGKLANLGMVIISFLLQFIVGSIMLCFVDVLIKDFKMRSIPVGIVAALIISVINSFIVSMF